MSGDSLKLVRFKLLFVKRDYECVFTEREELISDDIDPSVYSALKIAEFIESLRTGSTKVPWGEEYPATLYRDGDVLLGIPQEDQKYLRVFCEVLDRYPKRPAATPQAAS